MAWPPIHPLGLILLAIAGAITLLAILRVLAAEYERFVAWHDLRVECQEIRRKRLLLLLEAQGANLSPAQRAAAIRSLSSAVRQMRLLEEQTGEITAAQIAAGPFGRSSDRAAA